jgi:hypothetical protein
MFSTEELEFVVQQETRLHTQTGDDKVWPAQSQSVSFRNRLAIF